MASVMASVTETQGAGSGRLDLSNQAMPIDLPAGLRLRRLVVRGCGWLSELPAGLSCAELDARGSGLRRVPADLRVAFRLDLQGCAQLEELPEGLQVGTLVLRGCRRLARLPEGLCVNFLDIRECVLLSEWPRDLSVRIGRLNMAGCSRMTGVPEGLGRLSQLNIADCVNLRALPEGMEVASSLELSNSGLTGLPSSLRGVPLRWRGVPIDERVAFHPESITVAEVLAEDNAERRRVLLERVGLERFLAEAGAEVLDEDRDAGGPRRLLRVAMPGDEDLVVVLVHCPSTGGRYLLRVPPTMDTCRRAVAWTAGFDNADDYQPLAEA